ncbi:MAG: hypothetical protein H0U44_07320 [Flavisolibacter sp.]|nr:hypothetical protein [Flavisolibacter sp.]
MKKFLGLILIAGSLIACNDTSETTTDTDSTTNSIPPPPPLTVDTLNMNTGDTINAFPDSARTQ